MLSEVNEFSHLLVCGDFYYPDINWKTNSCSNHCSQLFLDAVQDKYLFQHVETPTRFAQNSALNVLDLVLINEEEMIDSINVLPAIEWEDLLAPLGVQSAYNKFSLTFTSIIDECVPFITPHQKKNIFMTREALHLRNRKK